MKNRITALLLLGLAGCAMIPQQYDNNEYELLARLEARTVIINENCDNEDVVKSHIEALDFDARTLHSYTFYIPRNTEVFEIAEILKNDTKEFKDQYDAGKGNATYCGLKTKIFLKKVRDTMEAVAQKPRG